MNIEERKWGNTAAFQTAMEIIAKRTEKKYFFFQEHQKRKKDGYMQYRNTKIMLLIRTALYVSVTGHQDMRKKSIMEKKDQIVHLQYSNVCLPVQFQLQYLLMQRTTKKFTSSTRTFMEDEIDAFNTEDIICSF